MKNFLIAVLAISLVSCKKEQKGIATFDNEKDAQLISSLKVAYGLSAFDVAPSQSQSDVIFSSLSGYTGVYSRIASKIQKKSIRLFENKNEGITVAMMRFEETPEKYYAVKGYFSKGAFQITNEFLFGRKITDQNSGQIVITNNSDAILIDVENGIQFFTQLGYNDAEYRIIQVKDCQGNHGGTGFCQREPGESFSNCYKAEKDEFCDGFWSCLAVDTQPQVMLLIAAACGCNATQCSK
ncbi:hypothetical protein [Parasegetibacter sp. NRK P23]|uniref:hypothetical protein n=1 Tax=Parasegetibacter sp. NRK P23 TaxID=2942999 RepID=UPI0020448B18|nr:hypothetical protein [Parasegetibacter sp. NRK P23]MCM5527883.1 hypothetical protein [Parasegetibacter sp. NRK P23]